MEFCFIMVLFTFAWFVGAFLTIKADSMLCRERADYSLDTLGLSLLLWPIVAILIINTEHDTYI